MTGDGGDDRHQFWPCLRCHNFWAAIDSQYVQDYRQELRIQSERDSVENTPIAQYYHREECGECGGSILTTFIERNGIWFSRQTFCGEFPCWGRNWKYVPTIKTVVSRLHYLWNSNLWVEDLPRARL